MWQQPGSTAAACSTAASSGAGSGASCDALDVWMASPAELLLDAAARFARGPCVVVSGAGDALLATALRQRGMPVAILDDVSSEDVRPDDAAASVDDRRAQVGAGLGNLGFGAGALDESAVARLRRRVGPGGFLGVAAFLRGSLDGLFDLYLEACEWLGCGASMAALSSTRASLHTDDGLRAVVRAHGGVEHAFGVEEHALFFDDGASFVRDPLVRALVAAMVPRHEKRLDDMLDVAVARAVDAYFGVTARRRRGGFPLRLRTGIVVVEVGPRVGAYDPIGRVATGERGHSSSLLS